MHFFSGQNTNGGGETVASIAISAVDKGSNVLYQLIFQFHRKHLYQVKNHEDICQGSVCSGILFLISYT